jgi:uncharacterized protein (DUF433 family)
LGTWLGRQVESAEALRPLLLRTRGHPMKAEELIERNPEKMGGVAVFTGTRVPVEFLFQFLEDDQTLETFLDQFPSVSRAQARSVLGASRDLLLSS